MSHEDTLLSLYKAGLSDREIGERVGSTKDSIRHWRKRSGLEANTAREFTIDPLPDATPPAEEILTRRRNQFLRKRKANLARTLINVNVNIAGPIAIAHFGDPHVDDDGTDIALLESHIKIVNNTPGMFAGNVGDYSNNWVGRIAHLFGQQSTSAQEAWVLVEWLIKACDWLYLIGGNHDAWSGDGDPLRWITRQQGALLESHGARLNLRLPSGREIRVNARHNWPGHSQWNPAHGVAKAAQMGHADHILTCGHTHVSGYQVVKQPTDGLITHALQVASYKTMDRYAEEKALRDQSIFVCPVTIVRPEYGDDDPRLITTVFDPESAADFLTFLRSRK